MPPMGYDFGALGATATTTSTFCCSLLTTTAANKPSASITGVWANVGGNAMTTAGGGYFMGNTWQTVGTQTTTTAPNKKNFLNPAASTLCGTVIANIVGGTGTQFNRINVGF